jgi:hypothetical protein
LKLYTDSDQRKSKIIKGGKRMPRIMKNMALDYMSGDITDVKWGSMKEDFFKAMEE